MSTQSSQPARCSANHALHKLVVITLVATMSYPIGASTDTEGLDPSMFSLRWFGTLGAVHSSERNADFTADLFKPDGAGHTHRWSYDVDSRIGGQITANFSDRLSAVVQADIQQQPDGKHTPDVEWANIRYQITSDFSMRVGRIRLPKFLVSDTREIGYSYTWVRPPMEMYMLAPVANSDGVDISYRLRLGDFVNTMQASYGSREVEFPDGAVDTGHGLWGIFITSEYGSTTLHLSAGKEISHVIPDAALGGDVPVTLLDAFRQFGPAGNAIAARYDFDGGQHLLTFVGLGASYSPNDWFVMSEWSQINTHSIIGTKAAWYISSGHRFGQFTPYLTYAELQANSNSSDFGLSVTTLAPGQAAIAADLNAELNVILRTAPAQRTISIGGRWDFPHSVALKLQYDHTRLGAGSNGTLRNLQPDFQPGGTVDVFSVVIDFVL
jgi:hypothetical protein